MRALAVAGLLAALAALSACQSPPSRPAPAGPGKSAALRNMERIAIAAHRCWFAANDPAFRAYSFANELNSFSGRPRFLLVPKGNYGGRPLLVVQAEGASGRVTAFGPLMDGPQGGRVSADIDRWAAGSSACSSAA
ncbi:MAG: hypothetical protein M9895_18595 [Aquamicrobium sp.]|uniref:hypothetical protein n=1 Tax=Aquamicrobium sp. TaxID=1872579 RepID=UPI00349EE4F7|nr:hypothetical protein [Aquamicrobium sp.]